MILHNTPNMLFIPISIVYVCISFGSRWGQCPLPSALAQQCRTLPQSNFILRLAITYITVSKTSNSWVCSLQTFLLFHVWYSLSSYTSILFISCLFSTLCWCFINHIYVYSFSSYTSIKLFIFMSYSLLMYILFMIFSSFTELLYKYFIH